MGYKLGSWQRTGARLTVDRHSVVFHQIRPKHRTQTSDTVRWPRELVITAVVNEAQHEQHGNRWTWSIVRGNRVIDSGSTLKETGARASVRRRLIDLVEATRKTAGVQAAEQQVVATRKAQGYDLGPLPPEDTTRVRGVFVDVEGDDETVSAALKLAGAAIGGGS